MSLVVGASLATLFGALNGITMIAYIAMINIIYPANFNVLNEVIVKLATFDMVPNIDEINDYLFTTHYSEGPIEQPAIGFSLNGFETHNFTKNSGSLYIFTIWILFSSLLFRLMKHLADRNYFVNFYKKYRINENLNEVMMQVVL